MLVLTALKRVSYLVNQNPNSKKVKVIIGFFLTLLAFFLLTVPRFVLPDSFNLPIVTEVPSKEILNQASANPNKLPLDPIRVEGFYLSEDNGEQKFRWTEPFAKVYLPQVATPQKLKMEVIGAYPAGYARPWLKLIYQAKELGNWELSDSWTSLEAQFPTLLEAATGPLELVIENSLPPRRDDKRTLGIAVRSAQLDVSKIAPPGLVFTGLALVLALIVLSLWVGWGWWKISLVTFLITSLLTFYWYSQPFYATLLVGWLIIGVIFLTMLALYPARFFAILQPHATSNSNLKATPGAGGSFNLVALLKGNFSFLLPSKTVLASSYQAPSFQKLKSISTLLFDCLACGLIILFLFWVYAPSLSYGFFWDDYHIARPWSVEQVAGTFVGSWDPLQIEPPYYRPITAASFALDWSIYGLNPTGYHFTNLLAYLAVALLLYVLLRRTDLAWLGALAATFTFIVLPNNVATANWISQRSDALATLFGLAGVLSLDMFWRSYFSKLKLGEVARLSSSAVPKMSFLRQRFGLTGWLVLMLFCLWLAFSSKEVAVAFPFIYLAYSWLVNLNRREVFYLNIWQKLGVNWKPLFVANLPPFLLLGFYFIYRGLVLPPTPANPRPDFSEAVWFGYYSGVYQSFYRLDTIFSFRAAPWFTLVIILAAGVALAQTKVKNSNWAGLSVGLAWLLIACAPLSLLGTTYQVTARVLYLPEIGFAIIIGALVSVLVKFLAYSRNSWYFIPTAMLLGFVLVAPYTPLFEANQRAQRDYAPTSFNTLRWDKWILENWQGKILDVHYKTIEEKVKKAAQEDK